MSMRGGVRKAKALLEFNPARVAKGWKKGFYECISSRREIRKICAHY